MRSSPNAIPPWEACHTPAPQEESKRAGFFFVIERAENLALDVLTVNTNRS